MAANAYQGLVGWTVGRFDWLDDPASKVNRYWRVIEEGSAATRWPWMGKRIVGLWGPDAEPRGALHGTGYSIFSEGVGSQKFIPYFTKMDADLESAKKAALMALFGAQRDGKRLLITRNAGLLYGDSPSEKRRSLYNLMNRVPLERTPFVQGEIHNPIEARQFYGRANEAFQPLNVEIQMLREELGGLLGGLDISSKSGLKRARGLVAMDSSGKARTGTRKMEGEPALGMGKVTVGASAYVQDFIRDGSGRFSNGAWQDMVRTVNERVARQFQEALVSLMRAERKRPPTGALIRAAEDPRNRYPN